MRIIGYGRVSTREQSENSHALEQQLQRLKDAGATELLFDVESGSKDTRENFNRLIEVVRGSACDEVIVTRLDRLTRSLPTMRKALDVFRKSGVNFRALDDSIDLSTAAGKFHLNMLGALAEMEVDRLSERVRHGWAHLRDRKVAMNPPFGYRKVENQHQLDHTPFLCLLSDCPEDPNLWGDSEDWCNPSSPPAAIQGRSKAAIAREIIDTFLEKQTLRLTMRVINERYGIQTFAHNNQPEKAKGGRVARDTFRFSPGGLSNWLTNPVLQGHLTYLRGRDYKGRKEIHYNTHPEHRLISDEEAQRIETILKHNKQVRGYGSTALKYPLSGLIFCAECRSSCYSMKGSRGKNLPGYNYYFQCKNWRLRACPQKSVVRMEKVEEAVIDALLKRVEAITRAAEMDGDQAEPMELKELRAELDFYLKAPGKRAEAIVIELRNQIEVLQNKAKWEDTAKAGNRELLLQVFGNSVYWKTLSDDEKREVYRALVDRVIVRDGEVEQVILKV